jgi:hypothetical protein
MKRLGALLFLLCAPSVAFAQADQPMAQWLDAQSGVSSNTPTALTNCNDAAANSSIATCGSHNNVTGVVADGYNLASFYVKYTYAAGTGWQFNIQCSNDGGTTWYNKTGCSLASGTDTCTKLLVTHAATASDNTLYEVGINCGMIRIANVIATGSPSSSDKITVYLRLGVSPGI